MAGRRPQAAREGVSGARCRTLLEHLAEARQRPAQHEVDRRHDAEHEERPERHVVDDLPGAGDLDEADDRGERRALHQQHQEADGRRDGDPAGLRQDHVAHAATGGAGRARSRPPIGRWESPRCSRARSRRGTRAAFSVSAIAAAIQRIDAGAQHSGAEEHQEELHQQRRALEQLDIGRGREAQPRRRRDVRAERDGQPADAAADEGDSRQQQRPAHGAR